MKYHSGSLIFATISVVISASVFVMNLDVEIPMIHADEGSYIASAAAIAGFPNDFASSYHSGYSVFLSPVFLLVTDPLNVWTGIKLVNSILLFASCVGLWVLSFKVSPGTIFAHRLMATTAISIFPT